MSTSEILDELKLVSIPENHTDWISDISNIPRLNLLAAGTADLRIKSLLSKIQLTASHITCMPNPTEAVEKLIIRMLLNQNKILEIAQLQPSVKDDDPISTLQHQHQTQSYAIAKYFLYDNGQLKDNEDLKQEISRLNDKIKVLTEALNQTNHGDKKITTHHHEVRQSNNNTLTDIPEY
jgi:predicted RNase H-like nuclease (RuvC/YqgF family)